MLSSATADNAHTANGVSELDAAEQIVAQFKQLYQALDASNCNSSIVDDVYSRNVLFQDSFHRIEGVDAMKEYFNALYLNLKSSEFTFHDHWIGSGSAMLTWTMIYSHGRLNGGREISIEGSTEIRFDEKVYFHKDYFDGGSLLYEHVPVLGTVIKQLKKYMAK